MHSRTRKARSHVLRNLGAVRAVRAFVVRRRRQRHSHNARVPLRRPQILHIFEDMDTWAIMLEYCCPPKLPTLFFVFGTFRKCKRTVLRQTKDSMERYDLTTWKSTVQVYAAQLFLESNTNPFLLLVRISFVC